MEPLTAQVRDVPFDCKYLTLEKLPGFDGFPVKVHVLEAPCPTWGEGRELALKALYFSYFVLH